VEIDHIFICTQNKAPAGDLFAAFGLAEGSPNIHPGQGTANRRFYFHNFMLELIWVEDKEEIRNERTKPLRLFERCQLDSKAVSPFGIAFRPEAGSKETLPFLVWDYHPIYLPANLDIQVAGNMPSSEPLVFYIPFARRQDSISIEKREPMEHRVPLGELTSATINIFQDTALSDAAFILNRIPGFSITYGPEHLLELEFDNRELGKSKDFRPDLPLVIRW
jgi:hypothetical protein